MLDLSQIGKKNIPGANINGVNIFEQPNLKCPEEDCGCETFLPVSLFKKISPLVSKSGQAELIPIETFMCTACGVVPKNFPQ